MVTAMVIGSFILAFIGHDRDTRDVYTAYDHEVTES